MQKSGSTPTQNAAPFFSSAAALLNPSKSRPGTSSGEQAQQQEQARPNVLVKERRPSLSKKASFSRKRRPSVATNAPPQLPSGAASESPSSRTAGSNSSTSLPASGGAGVGRRPSIAVVTDTGQPPALPDVGSGTRSAMSRGTPTPTMNGYSASQLAPPANLSTAGLPSEASLLHQHIQEMANKRISTLEYLKKAHEGRVYWFNALLFDKPDLMRMPYFDARKLARRATNYLLLGLSLPTVIDYNCSTPLELLRSLNVLLNEFDSFQQLHSENGSSAGSLSRARLPNMFRRAGPGGKARRTSGAANDIGYPLEPTDSNGGSSGGSGGGGGSGGAGGGNSSVMSFATSETDLLPGEEYTHLLTPSLPFDPDFFETFATLCDVLIDFYQRLLGLLPTPRECTPPIAELFTKADSRVRKIIIQGVVKEFEDSSRAGVKTEVANIGKVVLSGLM